jgi:hypothetical protein
MFVASHADEPVFMKEQYFLFTSYKFHEHDSTANTNTRSHW